MNCYTFLSLNENFLSHIVDQQADTEMPTAIRISVYLTVFKLIYGPDCSTVSIVMECVK